MITKTLIQVADGKAWATPEQAQTLSTLSETRKGGYARVYGYTATSGRVEPTVYDATVTTRFSYAKLNERKLQALKAMTFASILPTINLNSKLSALPLDKLAETFETRKQDEIASIELTQSGDRNDAYRQAHDRCYINIADGVVVHLVTEKDSNGIMQPVITDGFPSVASVMLNVLEVSRNVRVEGEYKKVNSGAPVLMSNIIKGELKRQGVRSFKRLTLTEGKFERVAIDSEVVLPEDVIALA
jgi:hypothetical protein